MNSETHEEIQTLFNRYVELYATKHELLSDRLGPDDSRTDVIAAVRATDQALGDASFGSTLPQTKEKLSIHVKDLVIHSLADDTAVASSTLLITHPKDEKDAYEESARLVLIFHLRAGKWRIAHNNISIPGELAAELQAFELRGSEGHNRSDEQISSAPGVDLGRTQSISTEPASSPKSKRDVERAGSWKWNIKIGHLEWSEEMFRLFGMEKEAPSGPLLEAMLKAVHPEDRESVERSHRSALEGKKSDPVEYRVVWQDGSVHSVLSESGYLTLDDHGTPLFLSGIVQGITEARRSEASFKEKEYILEESQRLSHIGSWLWDLEGPIQWSDETFRIYGISPDSIVLTPESIVKLIHLEDRQLVERWFVACSAGRSPGVLEYRILRPDGATRFLSGSGDMIYDSEHKPLYMAGTVHDITENKLAQEELADSEVRYRRLFETAQDGILILDAETGRIADVNPYLVHLLGYSREQFIEKAIWEIGSFKDILASKQKFLELQTKEYVRYENLPLETSAGEKINVEFVSNVYHVHHQKVIQCNIRNVTERKLAEEALGQAQKLKSIGTLAGGIAHDFNNLLNAILGQSILAMGKLPTESPARFHIEKSIKAAERAAELTKQMLAFSGKGKFVTEVIDLNNLVKENVQLLEVSVPKTAQLRFELDDTSPRILGDVSQLQQVVMNLIINAGESLGPNPGYITVCTGHIVLTRNDAEYWKYTVTPLEPGIYALLQVTDTGAGMKREVLAHIFDPFFTTKFTGRGLGLAAVLGIVRGHGGGVRITSAEEKGARFDIVFPLLHSSEQIRAPESELAKVTNGEGKTLLIIDDDPSVLELLTDIFTGAKFTVLGALNPVDGIEIFARRMDEIAMVILDYSMPGMNGKAAFEELSKLKKDVRVLLCSGYSEDEIQGGFGDVRPAGFIQKPYAPAAILKQLGLLLAK